MIQIDLSTVVSRIVVEVGCRKWRLQSFLRGFNMISKYGAHLKYKLTSPIKEWSDFPLYGSFQYLIILNLECAGVLPSFMILCPTYSARLLRKSHLSDWKLTQYF